MCWTMRVTFPSPIPTLEKQNDACSILNADFIETQSEHFSLPSFGISMALQREEDVDFRFQQRKACLPHNVRNKNVFSPSNTCFHSGFSLLSDSDTDLQTCSRGRTQRRKYEVELSVATTAQRRYPTTMSIKG